MTVGAMGNLSLYGQSIDSVFDLLGDALEMGETTEGRFASLF